MSRKSQNLCKILFKDIFDGSDINQKLYTGITVSIILMQNLCLQLMHKAALRINMSLFANLEMKSNQILESIGIFRHCQSKQ